MPRKLTPLPPLSVAGPPNAEHQAMLLEKGEALHGPLAYLRLTPVPLRDSQLSALAAKARLSRPDGASELRFLCLLCFVHRGSDILEEGLYNALSTNSLWHHLKRVHKEDLVIRQVNQRKSRTKWPTDVLAQGGEPEDWQLARKETSTERKDYKKRKTGSGVSSGAGSSALPKAEDKRDVESRDAAKSKEAAGKEARRRTAWEIQKASLRRLKERGIDVTRLDVMQGKVFGILPWVHEGLMAYAIKGRLTSTDQRQRELALQDVTFQGQTTLTPQDQMEVAAATELVRLGACLDQEVTTALACLVCLERRGFVAKSKGFFDGGSTSSVWHHLRQAHGEELGRLEAPTPTGPAKRRRKPSCLVELDESVGDSGDGEATGRLTSPLKALTEQGIDTREPVELDEKALTSRLTSPIESISPLGSLLAPSMESSGGSRGGGG